MLRSWDANKEPKQQQGLSVLPTGPGSHFPMQQELLSVGTATGAAAHTGKEERPTALGVPIASLPGKARKAMAFLAGCTGVNSKAL